MVVSTGELEGVLPSVEVLNEVDLDRIVDFGVAFFYFCKSKGARHFHICRSSSFHSSSQGYGGISRTAVGCSDLFGSC
jgi:hypothetical protein